MKSVYYFPHDFNASQDQKLIKLQREMGGDGLAIYWKLIERLGPETGHQLQDEDETYVSLEWDFHFSADKIRQVVTNYGLFVIEDGYFYSNSLRERLRVMEESKERRARAGSLGGKAKAANKQNNSNATKNKNNAKAEAEQCLSNGEGFEKEKKQKKNNEIKERKERKENNITEYIADNNDNNKKNSKKEKEDKPCGVQVNHFDERVTDDEFLAIMSNYMRKGARDPWEETVHLIDLMHPTWKGQYEDFYECKADACQCWEIKRDRKYINYSRLTVSECGNVDFYVQLSKTIGIRDRKFFEAYRGMVSQGKELIIYVRDMAAAMYLKTKYGEKMMAELEKTGCRNLILREIGKTNILTK